MITEDQLIIGKQYVVRNQGTCITPDTVNVTVRWIGAGTVHYTMEDSQKIRETSVDRFLSILNEE